MRYLIVILLFACNSPAPRVLGTYNNNKAYKLPDEYHFGYDSIQIFEYMDSSSGYHTIAVNPFARKIDSIRDERLALITVTDTGILTMIDSSYDILYHYKYNGIKEIPLAGYFSPDSINGILGTKHVIITNVGTWKPKLNIFTK